MKVSRLFEELQRQLPAHWEALERIRESMGTPAYGRALSEQFSSMRSISLDYGVMEGASEVEVVPVSLGWSDVGHWAALRELYPADSQGNVCVGDGHICLDAQDNVIYSVGPRAPQVALLGVQGLVVAHSPEALLICKVDESQRVREVVEALKARGDKHLL
jgi:mannose-1-phosphate guanylyltransferase